jgi:hypothetical protein
MVHFFDWLLCKLLVYHLGWNFVAVEVLKICLSALKFFHCKRVFK